MLIPHRDLAPETLRAIAEECVSRDGTQTGDLRAEADKLLRLLDGGKAVLCFETNGENEEESGGSCAILMREEWQKRERAKAQ